MKNIKKLIVTFSNGVRVINTTPHNLTFEDNGEVVIVPTSVPEGEKTGPLVLNARAVEEPAGNHLVRTRFVAAPEGEAIIAEIRDVDPDVFIVGSMIAVNAYPGEVVGMCPAPGYERVPPAQKRMSTEKFTIA